MIAYLIFQHNEIMWFNDTNTSTLSREIWSDKTLQALILSQALIGCLAVPQLLVLIKLLNNRAFHPNLRLILLNMSGGLFLLGFGGSGVTAEKIYTIFFKLPADSPLLETVEACLAKRVAILVPTYQVISAIVGIALERTYATVKFKTYEQERSITFAIIIIIMQVKFSVMESTFYQGRKLDSQV